LGNANTDLPGAGAAGVEESFFLQAANNTMVVINNVYFLIS